MKKQNGVKRGMELIVNSNWLREKQSKEKKITKHTVEKSIQRIENAIDKMIGDFIKNDSNNIFHIINLSKRIRNVADREKRKCENTYKDILEMEYNKMTDEGKSITIDETDYKYFNQLCEAGRLKRFSGVELKKAA